MERSNRLKKYCDTWALNSRSYEDVEILGHMSAIGCETLISARKTICDTCALNSRRYEDVEILGHTASIGRERSNGLRRLFVILGH